MTNPLGRAIALPVDCFQLSAFDHTLDFGPPLGLFSTLLRHLETSTEEQLHLNLRRLCEQHGLKEEELRNHMGVGHTFSLAVSF